MTVQLYVPSLGDLGNEKIFPSKLLLCPKTKQTKVKKFEFRTVDLIQDGCTRERE